MLRDTLTALLQPVVSGLGYDLWELEFLPGRGNALLRIYIDTEAHAGITVEDCERASRAVSEVLDAADPVPGQLHARGVVAGRGAPAARGAAFCAVRGRAGIRGDGASRRRAPPVQGPAGGGGGRRRSRWKWTAGLHRLPIAGIRKAHLAPDF